MTIDEIKDFKEEKIATRQQSQDKGRHPTGLSEDDKYLAKLGYKSELKRGLSAFMSFAFCFSSVGVICSNALIFDYGINTGGPVMLTIGWIIGSIFTLFIALNLAEICSTYPVSGSVYHWAGILAEKKYAGHSAFICGWFSFIGNAACDASFAYGLAQLISATVQLVQGPESALTNAQLSALSIGALVSFAIKNIAKIESQGWFNNFSAIYQVISTIGTFVVIIAVAPERSTSEFVWISSYNTTGMDNMVYVYIIGSLTTMYGMSGYESSSQISEETMNAQVAAPKGIVNGVIAAIFTGLAFFVGILYSINNNIEDTINGITDQPVINAFQIAFTDSDGNRILSGALVMSIVLIINVYLGGFTHMTVTTRIVYAMSRDGAFPGSKYITGIHPKIQFPVKSIIFVFFFDALLCLLPIVSDTAFSAITQISTIGYQISYAIPIILRITVSRNTFQQGPYNLGRYSFVIGWISSIWLVATSICFFFPVSFDENMQQTAENFNYTCVVVGGALLIAAFYWFLPKRLGGARHFFKGPPRPDEEGFERELEGFKEVKLCPVKQALGTEGQMLGNQNEEDLKAFEMNPADEFKGAEIELQNMSSNRPALGPELQYD